MWRRRGEEEEGGGDKEEEGGGQVKCTLDKIMSDLKLGLGTKAAGLCAGLRVQALDQSGPFLFVCLITEAEEKDGGDFPDEATGTPSLIRLCCLIL